MKTISDVVKQMRHCADEIELTNCYDLRMIATDTLRAWADRIEGAVTSCNSLMMREALKEIRATLSVYAMSSLANQEVKDYFEKVIEQALSAPPMNCDRFNNVKEAKIRYNAEVGYVPIWDGYYYEKFTNWLFAEAKGESK